MISDRLSTWLAGRNIYYGWVVVATTFLTGLATAGAMGSAGVMIEPLQQEFGWDTADISFAFAVRLLFYGLLGPFAAAFMNSFGVRKVVSAALLLIIVGLIGSCFITELWQLVLWWGVIVGVGTGMTALVLGATVATRWFSHRRGLVVGMMTAANATGQLVFLPLMAALTEAWGWRSALTFIIVVIIGAKLLVLLLMRDYPADLGLPVHGESAVTPPPAVKVGIGATLLAPLVALRDAAGNGTFWVLFGTFFVCGLSTNGLIQTHWIAICGDFGMAPVAAASTLAVIGVFDFIGTVGAGWLADRYDNRWLLFWFYGLRGLSLIYLSYSGFSFFELSIFAIFYGLDWIATVPPTVRLAAERFGPQRANLFFGWIFTGHQIGAAMAAWGAGAIRGDLSTYMPALQIAGIMCIVAALGVLTLRRSGNAARAVAA